MEKEQRYEVNNRGELVVGIPQVSNDRKSLVEQLFTRFGWTYELLSEISQAHYHIKVSNANLNKSYTFHLFHGNVRKEDPDRNRAEKKIQLGGLDPREYAQDMCLILGFYVFETTAIEDAVIVAWPVEQEKNYPNNPSLRVNMKQDILPAKNGGIYFDRTTGKNIVAFQPNFIYYYLEHYKELHDSGEVQPVIEEDHTAEWFAKEAALLGTVDEEAAELYGEFNSKFSPEVLKSLKGIDILHRIFLNETDKKDNLCYVLEYDKRYSLFGSLAGGTAFKYGLFYSWNNRSWMTGGSRKQEQLTEEQAIELGTKIRDELVLGAEIIEGFGDLTELKDYADLQAQLYAVMPNTMGKNWVMKYYHMIFPDLFPVFYSEDWQKKALDKANIEADENSFIRMGQIALFAKKCGISNVAFSKVIHNMGDTVPRVDSESMAAPYEFYSKKGGAQNLVIYGTPGCGKSFHVEKVLLNTLGVDEENRIRTTFYQDYTNTEFVGQILPKVDGDVVTYEFNPGPFTLALKKAVEHPEQPVALIIEELNRGNAPSIFGDIFQLLDRDPDGRSVYDITNVNIQDFLNKWFEEQSLHFERVRIPGNLYIIATMNTSDQNVFTLDTAFKRRWQFEKMRNKFSPAHEYKDYYVPGMDHITWEKLADAINKYIITRNDDLQSEDKQIGVYFIDRDSLCEKAEECSNEEKKKKFAYKLFEYLWDDVAKFARDQWFPAEIKSLDQLIDAYMIGTQVLKNVLNQ